MTDPIVLRAQGFLDEADKQFDVHADNVDRARKHLLLQSDHLNARAGVTARSNYYLPQITPAARSRAAKIFDVFTSGAPPIRFTPVNQDIPGSVEAIANQESFINDCFDEKELWLAWYEAFFMAEIFPLAALYQRWETESGPVSLIDQMGGISEEELITFSGPALDLLTPDTFRCELYARHKNQIRYYFITKEVSHDYVMGRYKQGHYPELNPNELKTASSSAWFSQRAKNRRFHDSYTKPESLVYEMVISFIFNELTGQWEQIIFIGDTLLSRKPIKKRPSIYLLSSFPLPGEIAGLSTAILGHASQNMTNEFLNQAIEANEQAIWSPILFNGAVTSNPVWEPMALWQVDKPETFRKLNEPQGVNDYFAFIKLLEERAQNTQAAYDTLQPVSNQSKQTAREYLGKKDSYDQVMSVNMQFYAAEIIRSIKDMISSAKENMQGWIELGLLNPGAPGGKLQPNDLFYDAKVELPNVKMLSDEPMEMAKWDTMYDRLMQNPLIATNPMGIHEVTKRYIQAHKEKNIDKIIGQSQALPPVMAQQGGNLAAQTQI